jgi:catechol 2,3-dioxygenase-like lactoylglutathione lyase family enzyme
MHLNTDGIDHINLMVIDLEETTLFWNKLMGFKILEEMAHENGRIIGNKHAMLAIYEVPGMERVDKNGFSHISFHINNFDDIERILKKMDLKMKYNKVFYWKRSRSVYIEDPNGYEIELAEKWGGGLV